MAYNSLRRHADRAVVGLFFWRRQADLHISRQVLQSEFLALTYQILQYSWL